ncbi:MAG: MBL fold metallo-hydrolase, partial [Solirubrobacterales bacterium]
MEITFHGHSCFTLAEGDTKVLIDPFLKPNNPAAVVTAEEVEPTHIALSHGHADHMADAVGVAKRTGAHCIAM